MNDDQKNNQKPEGFFYQPETIQWILRVFYALCVLVLVADFFVHRHIVTSIEKIPTFYGTYGFVACVILVLLSVQLRKWVIRGEDYYEGGSNKLGSKKVDSNQADKEKDHD